MYLYSIQHVIVGAMNMNMILKKNVKDSILVYFWSGYDDNSFGKIWS